MSKSKNNYIGITEAPFEMFGKVMSVSDELMWRWYDLVSTRSNAEIAGFRREVGEGRNPRDIKVALAQEIVTRFHSPSAAAHALAEFEARFRGNAAPADMPAVAVHAPQGLPIAQLLRQAQLAPSTSEAIRNIEQGGVRLDGEKVADRAAVIGPGTYVLQVGKRKWARVTVQ
jgi:tyrosyl-tRNA synthetase